MFITLTKVYSNEVRLFCELCLSGNKKTVQCTVFFHFPNLTSISQQAEHHCLLRQEHRSNRWKQFHSELPRDC